MSTSATAIVAITTTRHSKIQLQQQRKRATVGDIVNLFVVHVIVAQTTSIVHCTIIGATINQQ